MKVINKYLATLLVLCFCSTGISAQVQYSIEIGSDGETYTAFMQSSQTYTGFSALIANAQFTLVVPTATGADQFQLVKPSDDTPGVDGLQTNMTWSESGRNNAPVENPDFDYIYLGFSNSVLDPSSQTLFDINAGESIPLFTFKNAGACLGAVSIIENGVDPFVPPNSVSSNPENSMSIAGAGGESYDSNLNASAACDAVFACEADYGDVIVSSEFMDIYCSDDAIPVVTVENNNDSNDYSTVVVLTTGADLAIVDLLDLGSTIDGGTLAEGDYTLHAFNFLSEQLTAITDAVAGGATGVDVAGLIGDGTLCADLDVAGVTFSIDNDTCDDDGDGVENSMDNCPNTMPGAIVDANGCTDMDADGTFPDADAASADFDINDADPCVPNVNAANCDSCGANAGTIGQ